MRFTPAASSIYAIKSWSQAYKETPLICVKSFGLSVSAKIRSMITRTATDKVTAQSDWVYGSCHCRTVVFRCRLPARQELVRCNCSICDPVAYLHWLIPAKQFQLLQGHNNMTEYRFNTGTAAHWFCATCGIKSFYRPRSHPDCISVNARCLYSSEWKQWPVYEFNGAQWEKNIGSLP